SGPGYGGSHLSCEPHQLVELMPVLAVAAATALGGKIKLVPPLELSWWRQRHLVGPTAANQIPAHGDHGRTALWPERGDDVGRPRAPIKTRDNCLLDRERIHQCDNIDGEYRLLAVPEGVR